MIEFTDAWTWQDGKFVVEGHAAQIDELLAGPLVEISRDTSGWRIVYRHRTSGRFWELDRPQSELQDGGPRRLRELDALPYPDKIQR